MLKDRTYFYKHTFKLEIKKLIFLIPIYKINNKILNLNKYIIITIYMNDIINDIFKIIFLIIKVYLVKDLKINILINIDIITP